VDSILRTPQQGLNLALMHSNLTVSANFACWRAEIVQLDCAGPMIAPRSSSEALTQTSTSSWRTMRMIWSRY